MGDNLRIGPRDHPVENHHRESIMRRHFSKLLRTVFLTTFLIVGFVNLSQTHGATKPNILWIIGEDLGPEFACYGTPEV